VERRDFVIVLAAVASLWLLLPGWCWASHVELEYKVKAGFLLNFIKFMTWPPEVFSADKAPLVIGVVGDNPFTRGLEAIEAKEVGGRPLVVRQVAGAEEAASCQLLYISQSEQASYERLLKTLAGKPVVTVSDITGFGARGGMVEFTPVGDRLGFLINHSQAKASGIRIDATLLNLAVEVL
jgi:hypothetical protein